MRLCRNIVRPGLRLLLALALVGLFVMGRLAWAGTIEPITAKLTSSEDAYVLSAEFGVDLGSHFEDAVSRGVPL